MLNTIFKERNSSWNLKVSATIIPVGYGTGDQFVTMVSTMWRYCFQATRGAAGIIGQTTTAGGQGEQVCGFREGGGGEG